jgi:NAD(P)-dependent dehydrogenase (short-subunit alcohol dehydrogenase family)
LINAFLLRYVGTPLFLSALQSDVIQKEVTKVPMARIAQIDEIGDAISFLASPMSSYMCGTALIVDG